MNTNSPHRPSSDSKIIHYLILTALGLLATMLASAHPATTDPRPPFLLTAPGTESPKVVVTPINPPPAVAPAPSQPATYLAWNTEAVEYNAKPDELTAHFTFYVTNISDQVVTIYSLTRACGCTEAKLPQQPWPMEPLTNGPIVATIDLRGKSGRVSKPLTVNSSAGTKVLWLHANIPAAAAPQQGGLNMDRSRNMQLAMANRQAVFSGECAKCHAEPTVAKLGKDLYDAGCAICHDAQHRAAMVPDLRSLKHPTNADYWKQWISTSKPGSLMPAFSHAAGGPLNDEQIMSLVTYLAQTIPSR